MRGNQTDRLHGTLRAIAVIAREQLERLSNDPCLALAAPASVGSLVSAMPLTQTVGVRCLAQSAMVPAVSGDALCWLNDMF